MSRRNAKKSRRITSVRTKARLECSLKGYRKWADEEPHKIPASDLHKTDHQIAYLQYRAQHVRQNTLLCDRRALKWFYSNKLRAVYSVHPTELRSRSYRTDEVDAIAKHMTELDAMCTWLAFYSGLRTHEFARLARCEDIELSGRTWRADRFAGLPDIFIYSVKGKGGLVRQVALPRNLAQQLERYRRPQPVIVRDGLSNYQSYYSIPYGMTLSRRFCDASKKALGWSTGFHGLRHSYAKRRLAMLLAIGLPPSQALPVVSQELGHFRLKITFEYLR